MEGWHIALLVKPFALLALFTFTWWCARLVSRKLPEGRLKRILFFSWKV